LCSLSAEQQSSTVSSRFVVARPKPTWSSVMNFEVAVRPDAAVTAMHVPASPPEYGHPKHFLIGDERGRIHVLGMDGSIQGQYQIHESSPVTALSELRIRYVARRYHLCAWGSHVVGMHHGGGLSLFCSQACGGRPIQDEVGCYASLGCNHAACRCRGV
jgi:hypothetical protein